MVGGEATLLRLEAALGAVDRPIRWLSIDRLDIDQILERPPERSGPTAVAVAAVARVWVDCSDPSRARLYFADWSTERFLLRDVATPDGLSALSLETIAQMIETSLSALSADRTAGMNRVEMGHARSAARSKLRVARRASPPASALSPSSRGVLRGAGFRAGLAHRAQPGSRRGATARARGAWRLGGWLTRSVSAARDDRRRARGRAGGHALALRAGLEAAAPVQAGERRFVLGRAGARWRRDPPRGAAPCFRLGEPVLEEKKFYWDTMVQFAAGMEIRLDPHLALDVAILLDVDLVLRHYDVDLVGGTTRLATPWPLRPGVSAGLSWR